MLDKVTLRNSLEMAVKTEKVGAAFYRALADRFADNEPAHDARGGRRDEQPRLRAGLLGLTPQELHARVGRGSIVGQPRRLAVRAALGHVRVAPSAPVRRALGRSVVDPALHVVEQALAEAAAPVGAADVHAAAERGLVSLGLQVVAYGPGICRQPRPIVP